MVTTTAAALFSSKHFWLRCRSKVLVSDRMCSLNDKSFGGWCHLTESVHSMVAACDQQTENDNVRRIVGMPAQVHAVEGSYESRIRRQRRAFGYYFSAINCARLVKSGINEAPIQLEAWHASCKLGLLAVQEGWLTLTNP
jgi:hypothetical protein